MGESSGVCAFVVVEAQVGIELALQASVAQVEIAGEGWAPALLEDRALHALDVAVGLWRAAADAAVAGPELVQSVGERWAGELVAVVARSSFQPAAFSSRATRLARTLACRPVGLPCLQITSSAHA